MSCFKHQPGARHAAVINVSGQLWSRQVWQITLRAAARRPPPHARASAGGASRQAPALPPATPGHLKPSCRCHGKRHRRNWQAGLGYPAWRRIFAAHGRNAAQTRPLPRCAKALSPSNHPQAAQTSRRNRPGAARTGKLPAPFSACIRVLAAEARQAVVRPGAPRLVHASASPPVCRARVRRRTLAALAALGQPSLATQQGCFFAPLPPSAAQAKSIHPAWGRVSWQPFVRCCPCSRHAGPPQRSPPRQARPWERSSTSMAMPKGVFSMQHGGPAFPLSNPCWTCCRRHRRPPPLDRNRM